MSGLTTMIGGKRRSDKASLSRILTSLHQTHDWFENGMVDDDDDVIMEQVGRR